MMRVWLVLAGLSGAVAVGLGAVAAHALAGDAVAAGLVDKAARYQLTHALALLGVALWRRSGGGWAALVAGVLFATGTVLFCGSLYAHAFHLITSTPLAPVGGSSFILGWLAVAAGGLASKGGNRG